MSTGHICKQIEENKAYVVVYLIVETPSKFQNPL